MIHPTKEQIDVAEEAYWRSRRQINWRSNLSQQTQEDIRNALMAALIAVLATVEDAPLTSAERQPDA